MKTSGLRVMLMAALIGWALPSWADRLEVQQADKTWSKVTGHGGAIDTYCTNCPGGDVTLGTVAIDQTGTANDVNINGTVTVTGTVTVEQGTGTNLHVVCDSGCSGGGGGGGDATAANQTTEISHLNAIKTSVESVDQTEDTAHASGDKGTMPLSVRKDTPAALADTDGDYAPLQTDDTGSLWIRCRTGCSGGTQYAEDAAHSSGDTGTVALGVRRDADTSPVSADGDYHALQFDNAGNLKVNIKAGAGSGGTAMTDDAAFTPGTTSVTPVGYMFDDVAPDSVNEGDIGVGRMSANRNQYVTLRDAAGNERGLNIDGSGNITVNLIPGTSAASIGKTEDAAHTTGDTGVMMLGIRNTSGATLADTTLDYSPIAVDEVGAVFTSPRVGGNGISGASVPRVTIASDSTGNIATIGTSVTPGTSAGHLGKAEDAAHASGDTGVSILCRRIDSAATSAGTSGDYATVDCDASGRVYVNPTTIGVEDAAETAGGNLNMVGTVRRDTAASSAGTTGDNATLNTDANGKVWANAEITQGGNSAQVTASGTLKITNYDSSGNEIVVPTAGLTSYTAAGASTNATSVKGSAGTVYHYSVTNTTTTIYYLRMYNLATAPTCSSATGYVSTIPIPPAAAAGGAGGREMPRTIGQAFTTGVAFCITGGANSTDNTNAASGVFVEILYK